MDTIYNKPFILNRADPHVEKGADGTYYFTATSPKYDQIVLRSAGTMDRLRDAQEIVVWTRHESGKMASHVWAPELHFVMGDWYIYFAAGELPDIWEIRPYVLKCTGSDPMKDPFVELGQMQAADGDSFSFQAFSLDATVFEIAGEWYYVWAEKVSVGRQISNLYIAKMETPNKLKTAQVLLTTPDYDWERVGFWVNEGPYLLRHGKKLYLTYSASETGACYCVGMLTAELGSDLLDPLSWKKSRYPVLVTDEEKGIFGPGHNCFVKSEDGSEDIMVFHARTHNEISGDPLDNPDRHAMRLKVQWDGDTPVFSYENLIVG